MSKKYILFLVSVIYLFFVTIVIKPWEFKYFSLIDDPIVLTQTSHYYDDCRSGKGCSLYFRQIFETGSKRFRPAYWLINNFLYKVSGSNAQAIHVIRYYVLGLTAVLAVAVVTLDAGGGVRATLLASSLLFINPSFTENAVRLGTPELYLIIVLPVLSLLYLTRDKFKIFVRRPAIFYFIFLTLLLLAVFIKESGIVIVAAVLGIEFYEKRSKFDKWFILIGLIAGLLYLIGIRVGSKFPPNTLASFPDYISNYSFLPAFIFSNFINNLKLLFNLTTPLLKTDIALIMLLFLTKEGRKFLSQRKTLFPITLSVFYFLVLVPWKYVLGRYHLVTLIGVFAFSGLIIEKALNIFKESKYFPKKLPEFGFEVLVFVIISNTFFKNFALTYPQSVNYAEWFKIFTKFESEQVQILTKYPNERIFLNGTSDLDNLEIVYGIPIEQEYLYKQKILVSQLSHQLPKNGFILSRSSLVPVIDPKLFSTEKDVIDSGYYETKQIDPLRFRDSFLINPIETLANPPLSDSLLNYYWELRKI